jgi:carbon storage regulator
MRYGSRSRPFTEVERMLVLSRKVGEEVVIGEGIRVRVLAIQGNQIRLGFVAPRDVQIHREELLQPGRAKLEPQPDHVVEDGPRKDTHKEV